MIRTQKISFFCHKILQQKSLQTFKLRYPGKKPTTWDEEKKAYKKLLKESRIKNFQDYWVQQTQIENKFLENYQKDQVLKKANDDLKFRTSIVKISYATQQRINEIKKNDLVAKAKLDKWLTHQEMINMNRKKILKILNIESEEWYTPENLERKMKDTILIPDVVYDQTDYYLKLQEQALLFEQADFEGLENALSDVKYIKYKNKLLMPLYMEIVSLIKHIDNTEINKLKNEFNSTKSLLYQNNQELETNLAKVERIYSELLQKAYEDLQKPKNQIKFLQTNLLYLYNLLRKWQKYIKIVKMNNNQIANIMDMEKQSYGLKEDQDFQQYGEEEDFSDALTSANENQTSDSDAELDLQQQGQSMFSESEQKTLKNSFNQAIDSSQQINFNKTDERTKTQKKIDDLFDQMEKTRSHEQEFESQFDDMIANQVSKEKILYGFDKQEQAIDIKEFLKNKNIEMTFPQSLIDKVDDFSTPQLEFQSVEDVKRMNKENKQTFEALESSVIVEIYKKKLENLEKSPELSRKEKNQISSLYKLIDSVAELKIEEPQMLLKVWNIYKKNY